MKNPILISLFFLLFISFSCKAQDMYDLSTTNKKAIKAFNKSLDYIKAKNYPSAEKEAKKAIKYDDNFTEAYLLLGDIYADQKKIEEAAQSYYKAIEISQLKKPSLYFIYANFMMRCGKYQEAKKSYQTYLDLSSSKKLNSEIIYSVERNMAICDFAIEAMENPVPFVPVNMGAAINTALNEYAPVISADDSTLIYTRQIKDDRSTRREHEDLYISYKNGDAWSIGKNMGTPINTYTNEGQACISVDGKIIIFTICHDEFGDYGANRQGYGSCDLFFSKKTGDNWSAPRNIGAPINTQGWEAQPSYSSDGRTVYFAASRKDGFGDSDIWKSTIDEKGYWGNPENLGSVINTKGTDFAPFIHPDNQTLYFSSDGHPGMGKLDIFYSRKDALGNWTTPVNIGYPINTFNDEQGFFVNAAGNRAYFASDKEDGFGGFDIYYFDLYEEARPKLVTYLKGIVYNSKNNEKLDAKFELIDLNTGQIVVESYSDKLNGEFLVSITSDNDYALNVSKNGYLFYSENFTLTGHKSDIDPYTKNIPLQPIEIGESIVLKNIFFDTDKFDLKDESLIELNKLVDFLNKNKTIIVEISGHTDNQGSSEHNKTLSENRAKAVYTFLVANKIPENRLSFKGYGDTRPVDTNETVEGRAVNRRTEMKIISR